MSWVAEKLRQSNDRLRWMEKTQRRELESQVAERTALLRESEERLAAALRAGKLGVYDYDPRTKIIKWDSTVYRLFGVPEGESVTYETFEAGVHPEDIAAVRRVPEGEPVTYETFKAGVHPDDMAAVQRGGGAVSRSWRQPSL